ncbi:MAG: PEP-CTERM sorting domain-containing protein [Candidatus Hydrogenedentes bacterium]|nr:PEP-CTERM sorting domain-containing protein [Candidatus Hydrogenedentota bacterium]
MFTRKAVVILAAMVLITVANATVVDLTAVGSSGTIDGALFFQWDGGSTGTGNIDSFVEIGANTDITQAYNTTVNGTLDNGAADPFNHELLLTAVPIVNIGGVDYREFLLDINQSGSDSLLSLDAIQLFTSDTANQSVETFDGSGILELADASLVYDLDGLEDSHVLMDYILNGGSGNGDVLFYVPNSVFATGDAYVYLYSRFGETENANAGFEEWAVQEGGAGVIPEPTTVVLLGLGLAATAVRRRFHKS